jgi:hypothetical protein
MLVKVTELPGDPEVWQRPMPVSGQDAAKYRTSPASTSRVYKLVPAKEDPRAEHRCAVCGHRFQGLVLFEAHRVGEEHTPSRRCLRSSEMHKLKFHRRDGGTWYSTKDTKLDRRVIERLAGLR